MVRLSAFIFGLMTWLALLLPASLQAQESPIEPRRAIYERDVDYYGGDLRAIYETRAEICESACLADSQCTALTYNNRVGACFLKSEQSERQPYEGALSARIVAVDPGILRGSVARAAALDFLSQSYLDAARTQPGSIARDYPDRGISAKELRQLGQQARQNGDDSRALSYLLPAQVLDDRADGWLDISRIAATLDTGNYSRTRQSRRDAISAAINGYLRAIDPPLQAEAMRVLAEALEAAGETRPLVASLRLAQRLSPGAAGEQALERAIALYGFRVIEHQVDADAAQPRACVTFSEDLVPGGFDYAPYVRVEGSDLPVAGDERQLCVEGLTHGQRYAVTLRAGLPALSGEALNRDIELQLYVRDRSPSVRFLGRAYVLPRAADATIPIVSVNAEKVRLRIYNVGERNLSTILQSDLLGDPLGSYYEREIANKLGAEVWSGWGDVAMQLNRDVTTALPVAEVMGDGAGFAPGVYAMTAEVEGSDPDSDARATQWFIVTDIGLSSLQGSDGLHVFTRNLSDAKPLAGAVVSLVAINNDVLGEAVTDAEGYAHFAPGLTRGTRGAAPAMVAVETSGGDFAFLQLDEPGFDLTDRGVAGRASPPPMDVFMSTERGAYRPGETVHATILARDARADAISNLPLTAIILRPDGVEHSRQVLPDTGAGGRVMELALSRASQRGTWRLRVHADPATPALAETSFLVEDFEPERIDFTLDLPEGPLPSTGSVEMQIAARYLYGAPGAGLAIEGEMYFATTDTIAAYPGFRFGLLDDALYVPIENLPASVQTDGQGAARLSLAMPSIDPTTRPLDMNVTVRLRDGSGRPVEREITRPLAATGPMIGIRPQFDDVLPEGASARLQVLALDASGARDPDADLKWVIDRIETDYQWYQLDGYWNYERIHRRTRVANGDLTLGNDGEALVEAPVTWGEYELRVTSSGATFTAASTRFHAGWHGAGAGSDTPDRLEVSLDKPGYAPGDTARLQILARDAGEVVVAVLSDRLIARQTLSVPAGATTIDLEVTDDWAPGAYVTATLIRPLDAAAGRNPSRALGLGWVSVDPGTRRLQARFVSADEFDPRGPMLAQLQVDGVAPGETAYATIAAVDIGILNMTGFDVPDPSDHYFGQRKLGVEIHDLYGRLIDGMTGAPGAMRSGGDGSIASMTGPPPSQDLVAYFSGLLTVGPDGSVEAPFDLPDFNGTVKLMAVVWSGRGVGQASQDVLVRDPVVLDVAMPRFLAPGDRAEMRLDLTHISGPAGEMELQVSSDGGLKLPSGAQRVALAEAGRAQLILPLVAGEVGDNEITISLRTPDGRDLQKTLRMGVRANDPPIARQSRLSLKPGEELRLDGALLAGLVAGSGQVTLAAGPLARFDAPGLLQALANYPYGCTEQITARAMPLLYLDAVAAKLATGPQAPIAMRISEAITGVLANQASGGDFGLWYPGGGDLWLDAFVTDFLSRARAQGHDVPERAFEVALDNLRNRVNYAGDFERGGEGIAYALLVLSREGRASVGDLRYYADARAEAFATPMAQAQIGAALALYGDRARADTMFALAAGGLRGAERDSDVWRIDYGSGMRDMAAVLTLAAEAGSEVFDQNALAEQLGLALARDPYHSTQENLWALMAANAMLRETAAGSLSLNGRTMDGPMAEVFDASAMARGGIAVIRNEGDKAVATVLTTIGVPSEPEPAQGRGYRIERSAYTLDGRPVSLDQVDQNARLVIVLSVTSERDSEARLMVSDPLPAGLEIDNPNILRAGDVAALDWLDLSDVTEAVEFRSDRFLAAVNWSGTGNFRLAYIVRATAAGDFHHPAASVEDMYRPAFRARTAASRVEILSAP